MIPTSKTLPTAEVMFRRKRSHNAYPRHPLMLRYLCPLGAAYVSGRRGKSLFSRVSSALHSSRLTAADGPRRLRSRRVQIHLNDPLPSDEGGVSSELWSAVATPNPLFISSEYSMAFLYTF
ncbi:hypothetical protein EVAR_96182_1 [Eumeta japonica]|uniref:Uncharacterized protein n=1 Tax=Eumeta variegata TaxID=151549 RepID=A0A4C1VJ18_EUMVA|nr:hypothetical protein EVAR_96182_1 [Eumeta japonica]